MLTAIGMFHQRDLNTKLNNTNVMRNDALQHGDTIQHNTLYTTQNDDTKVQTSLQISLKALALVYSKPVLGDFKFKIYKLGIFCITVTTTLIICSTISFNKIIWCVILYFNHN